MSNCHTFYFPSTTATSFWINFTCKAKAATWFCK